MNAQRQAWLRLNDAGRTGAIMKCLTLWVVFGVTCFSLLYTVYKHHNYELVPGDHGPYMEMAQKPLRNEAGNPYSYRLLTPLLVHLFAKVGPSYSIPIASGLPAHGQQYLFCFCLINYAFLCATAALMAYLFAEFFGFGWWMAVAGGYIMLCSFPSVVSSIMPSTDAGSVFFIVLALIGLKSHSRLLFVIAVVAGAVQKETTLVAIFGIVVLTQIEQKRFHVFEYAVLAVTVGGHLVHKMLIPASGYEQFYSLSVIAQNFVNIFRPSTYSASALRHLLLSNISLILAAIVHGVLRFKKEAPLQFPVHYLFLLPYLFVFGMLFIHPNNVMRFIAFAAPFTIGYQLAVLSRIREVLGPCDGEAVQCREGADS